MIKIIGVNPQIEAMFTGKHKLTEGTSFCLFCEKASQVLEHGTKNREAYKRFRSERKFYLSPNLFKEARDYFHVNSGHREEIVPVIDNGGKRVAYVYWVRNYLRDNSIYQGMYAADFWDYDFENSPVNDFVLNWAGCYVFSQLEEYTYSIAKYILKRFPNRPVFFVDHMADLELWGTDKENVKVIKSFFDIPDSCQSNCMQITTSEYNAYSDYAPESKGLVYNSLNIMYSMLWGSHISHPGKKHSDKVVVKIDNRFASVGLVDIIKITMNFAYQAEMQGYVPVADLSQEGCCQYWEPGTNVWEELFEPLSELTIKDTKECANLISARNEVRGWLVSDWRSNPLWREADYQALSKGDWSNRPYLSDNAWDFVKRHAPIPLKERITELASAERKKCLYLRREDNMRVLGVIVRGTDYRKEAFAENEKNANNASVEQMLSWCKDMMAIGGYAYLFLATEDEDYFRLFKENFSEDKILYVDQPRVHLDLSLGKRITTDVLFKDKKVAGLDLAKLYLTVLKCLVVCDDLISSMDNGTYRQVLRWNAGRFSFARIIKEGEVLPVSGKKISPRVENLAKSDVNKDVQAVVKEESMRTGEIPLNRNINCRSLLSDRRRALWVEGNITHMKKPNLLRKGDFFIVVNNAEYGTFLHGAPVCGLEVLDNLEEKPLVFLYLKKIDDAKKTLMSYGYVEGKDFFSAFDVTKEIKEEEKKSIVSEPLKVASIGIKDKLPESKSMPKVSEEKKSKVEPINVESSKLSPYDEFLHRYGQVTELDRLDMARDIAFFERKPLISIIMPVYNPAENFFRLALESVLNQVYPNWELCMADDASTDPVVKKVIEEYRQKDSRIKVIYRNKNGHICNASNSALGIVSGEFIALMDHDDIMQPEAIYCIVKDINKSQGQVDMLYTDMDYIDGEGHRSNPRFGPDFSLYPFCAWNMVAHLDVYRTSIVREIGGFRTGYEGSQDHDLTLRFQSRTVPSRIHHIPHVCYSWRRFNDYHTVSADKGLEKCKDVAYQAVYDLFAGREDIEVISKPHTDYLPRLPELIPLVSIIIVTKDKGQLVKECVESIKALTDYSNYEIIVLYDKSSNNGLKKSMRHINKVRIYAYDISYNYSRAYNYAVNLAKGDCYLFLDDDIKIIESGWLDSMVRHLMETSIGVVGAKIVSENGSVQHGGMVLGVNGIAGCPGIGMAGNAGGYRNYLHLVRECSVVSGACLLIKRDTFEEIKGWDEVKFPNYYNDIDLCLRIKNIDRRVIYDARSVLCARGGSSCVRIWADSVEKNQQEMKEIAQHKIYEQYGTCLVSDPFYNPNLTNEKTDWSIAVYPRVGKPWRPWVELVCPFSLDEVLLGIQVAHQSCLQGIKVRLHTATEFLPFVSDFPVSFQVLPIPSNAFSREKNITEYGKACEYVISLPDSSGHIVGACLNNDDNANYSLNYVENLQFQLGIPVGTKMKPLLPKNREAVVLGDKIALLFPEGSQLDANLPDKITSLILEVLHKAGFSVIQVGSSKSKAVDGCDGYLLKDNTAGFWRTVFEKSSLIISSDSWAGHMAAILNRPHVVIDRGTGRQACNSKLLFEEGMNTCLVIENFSLKENTLNDFLLRLSKEM